jgi:hypothetical protein
VVVVVDVLVVVGRLPCDLVVVLVEVVAVLVRLGASSSSSKSSGSEGVACCFLRPKITSLLLRCAGNRR